VWIRWWLCLRRAATWLHTYGRFVSFWLGLAWLAELWLINGCLVSFQCSDLLSVKRLGIKCTFYLQCTQLLGGCRFHGVLPYKLTNFILKKNCHQCFKIFAFLAPTSMQVSIGMCCDWWRRCNKLSFGREGCWELFRFVSTSLCLQQEI
jgi:hypothetical protein